MALDKGNIGKFPTPHGKGEGGGGGTTIVMGGRNAQIPANINVSSINAASGDITNIKGNSLTYNDGQFIYLAADDGSIIKVHGTDLQYTNGNISSLTSDSINTGKLNATDIEAEKAQIANILSSNITTDYLTVTKQAHFFELIIDKIKSVGGQIILTPTSCVADYVITGPDGTIGYDENEEPITGPLYYDVYFRADDEDKREIKNGWLINDQAICQNFNNAQAGYNQNIQNKYYWRLVTDVANAPVWMNLRTGETLNTNNDNPNNTSVIIKSLEVTANYSIIEEGETVDTSETFNDSYFNIDEMKIGLIDKADWTPAPEGSDYIGTMTTYDTIFGVQISPKSESELEEGQQPIYTIVPNSFKMITPGITNLNVGFYYTDDTSQYFPVAGTWLDSENNETNDATEAVATKYEFELISNAPLEAISITNSDEPDWHLCHRIRLGNNNSNPNDLQVDEKYNPYSATTPSVPEPGDSIVQLGYRYNKYSPGQSEYDVKRASAIIIASYHTPDSDKQTPDGKIIKGINPPSYAQYKKITDFNLNEHRHTYFDADGSKFYGNFYIGPDDSDPDDYVPISDLEAEVYKIVPSDDVITKDINDKITPPTLTCSFMVPNQSELVNVVPPGCVFNYWKDNGNVVSISAGNAVSITLWDQNNPSVNLQNKIILQLAKLTGDSGQQGPQGSQGVQTQKILDQILKPVVEIDVANGQDGLPGDFTEWVYRNGVNGENLPTNGQVFDESNPDTSKGWSKTATTPPDGQFTWCTSRDNKWIRTASGPAIDYGDWQTAYRITGNNGKNGEDGDPGTAGANGKYIEFIYKHFTTEPTFENEGDNNNPACWDETDDPDYYAYGWDDHPQGLGTIDNVFYEFEYMSQREFDGEHFGKFKTPVIWSRWGQNGRDGDGYEYIYTLLDTEPTEQTHPNNISYGEVGPQGVANGRVTNKNQDEWVPNGWTDEPQGVSSTAGKTKEWVSMRKKSGSTNRNWGTFSDPALWAQYVSKGTNGGRYYFLYANYGSTGTRPGVIPTGSSRHTVSDLTDNGWSLYSTTPDYANNKYTYMTQAFFNDGDSDAVWSAPARITGDNGQKGEDGSFTEFIYTRNNTGGAPDAPTGTYPRDWPNNGSTDHQTVNGVTWYDNPQGVTESMMYEYVSSREYNGATGNWTPYSKPVIWSKWGEKGEDGDGYEYVFLLWMSATAPTIYSNDTYKGKTKTDDGYLPYSLDPSNNRSRWSDKPVSPTSSTRYVYVSMRKKTSEGWGNFSPAKLWTKYAQDGATGPTGPQGSQGSSGQNGTNGTNGVSPIEYKLMDLGSSASVKMSLNESNNQINQTLSVKLKFRILRCEGSVSRYLYSSEIGNKRVYYRMSQQQDGTTYRYKPLNINTSGTYVQFTIDYTTSYKRIIDDNYNITVSLIDNAINSNGQIIDPIGDTQITSYPIFDTTNISVTLESGAAINVVQKDVNGLASISSLVTGPQGISQIWQSMNGIQSSVSTVQNNVNNINNNLNNNYATKTYVTSQINQEAGVIESSVKESIKGGGGYNLIMNGNYSFGTISPTAKYWENWNYSHNGTTYTPTSRFIYTDNNNYRWLTVKSKYKWQGYKQSHYNDHGITINGGQTYTLSFRAYVVEDSYNPKTGEYSPSAKLQICFHWHNDTSTYQQYYSRSIPQINRYIDIDKTDRLHYVTFDAKQYDSFTNGSSNLYVNNGYSWVSTGEPAKWFEFMIGSGAGDYDNPVTQYFRITDITLTPGSIAQGWTPSTVEQDIKTESRITQTANSITTSVNDLSTRLDNGGFTINANTTINGQLTINNSSEQGFIVTGDNGNTSVLSKSIGTYNNFKNNATPWKTAQKYISYAYWSTSSNSYSTGSEKISLGYVTSGTKLRFNTFSCSAHKSNSGYNYAIGSWTGKIEIYNGNDKVHDITPVNSSSTQKTYTTTAAGTYSLKLYWTIDSLSMNGQSVSSATIDTTFAMYVYIPSGTYTLIGYDGIASNFGNNNTVFFGQEGTYIRYTDNNVLRVSNKGIQKYAGSAADGYATEWTPINGCSVRRITSTPQSLKQNDDLITYSNTGNYVFYLGYPGGDNIGRKVYMRAKAAKVNVTVYGRPSNGSGSYIMNTDNNATSESVSLSDDMNGFISDGIHWLRMNLQ